MNIPDDKVRTVQLDEANPGLAGISMATEMVAPMLDMITGGERAASVQAWGSLMAALAGVLANRIGAEEADAILVMAREALAKMTAELGTAKIH